MKLPWKPSMFIPEIPRSPHFSGLTLVKTRHRWMTPLRTDARMGTARRMGRQFFVEFSIANLGQKNVVHVKSGWIWGFLVQFLTVEVLICCWHPPLISCSLHCTDITPTAFGRQWSAHFSWRWSWRSDMKIGIRFNQQNTGSQPMKMYVSPTKWNFANEIWFNQENVDI